MNPATRLTITSDTSIDKVVDFLNDTGHAQRIRARDHKDGRIELYVRKDSFKQFFTDKLRLSCHVQQDYNAARSLILDIIKKADPAGENSSALRSIKTSLASDKHDFRANGFERKLQNALNSGIAEAMEILGMQYSNVDSRNEFAKFIQNPEVQEEILNVIESIKNPANYETFNKNFSALNSITSRPSPMGHTTPPTIIDYNCAIDFFRVWLKEVKETDSDMKNQNDISGNEVSKEKKALTEFAERITRGGVPLQIDLNGGKMQNSDADLIIFDLSTDFSFLRHGGENADDHVDKKETVIYNDKYTFKTKTYSEKKVTDEEKLIAGFEINFLPGQEINQLFMDSVYNNIEIAIREKMAQKIKSSPKSMTGNTNANEIFTIHLPVMNPDANRNLTPAEKTLLRESFAKATKNWVHAFPNLRIKVNLASDMDVSSIQKSYRNIDKPQRMN
jgi:hypothetical protein